MYLALSIPSCNSNSINSGPLYSICKLAYIIIPIQKFLFNLYGLLHCSHPQKFPSLLLFVLFNKFIEDILVHSIQKNVFSLMKCQLKLFSVFNIHNLQQYYIFLSYFYILRNFSTKYITSQLFLLIKRVVMII